MYLTVVYEMCFFMGLPNMFSKDIFKKSSYAKESQNPKALKAKIAMSTRTLTFHWWNAIYLFLTFEVEPFLLESNELQ